MINMKQKYFERRGGTWQRENETRGRRGREKKLMKRNKIIMSMLLNLQLAMRYVDIAHRRRLS